MVVQVSQQQEKYPEDTGEPYISIIRLAHILYFKKNPNTVYIPMGVTAALTLVDHGVDVAVNVLNNRHA